MGVLNDRKTTLKQKSSKNLSIFRKVVENMKSTIKEIEIEEKKEEDKIKLAKANLDDYSKMKSENTNVISGITALLNGELKVPSVAEGVIGDMPDPNKEEK